MIEREEAEHVREEKNKRKRNSSSEKHAKEPYNSRRALQQSPAQLQKSPVQIQKSPARRCAPGVVCVQYHRCSAINILAEPVKKSPLEEPYKEARQYRCSTAAGPSL